MNAYQDRIDADRKALADAQARGQADAKHRHRIHAEIDMDLRRVVPTDYGDIITAIADGRIRHLRIIY